MPTKPPVDDELLPEELLEGEEPLEDELLEPPQSGSPLPPPHATSAEQAETAINNR